MTLLYDIHNGQTSVVLRVKLRNSSVSTGAGLTGLTSASTGLVISTIADNEAAATAYTVAASHIQTIATLGTYAAPSASNCRFKEVDSTNHPGLYEVQIADARFGVTSAKSLTISFSGATNLAECDVVVPLRAVDPYNGVSFGLSGVPISSNLKKNTALNGFEFPMVLSTDHVTPAIGKTLTATVSLNGATYVATTNAATEVGNGTYMINLAAADTNANTVTLQFTATGCDTTFVYFVTQP